MAGQEHFRNKAFLYCRLLAVALNGSPFVFREYLGLCFCEVYVLCCEYRFEHLSAFLSCHQAAAIRTLDGALLVP